MTTLNAEQIGGKVVQNGQSTVEEEVINGGGTTTATEGTKETNLEEATDAETTAVGSAAVGEKDEAKVENGEATEEETVNGAESADERAFGTKTPPGVEQRKTPPQSANTRASTRKRRSAAPIFQNSTVTPKRINTSANKSNKNSTNNIDKGSSSNTTSAEDPFNFSTQSDVHPEPLKNISIERSSFNEVKFTKSLPSSADRYANMEKIAASRNPLLAASLSAQTSNSKDSLSHLSSMTNSSIRLDFGDSVSTSKSSASRIGGQHATITKVGNSTTRKRRSNASSATATPRSSTATKRARSSARRKRKTRSRADDDDDDNDEDDDEEEEEDLEQAEEEDNREATCDENVRMEVDSEQKSGTTTSSGGRRGRKRGTTPKAMTGPFTPSDGNGLIKTPERGSTSRRSSGLNSARKMAEEQKRKEEAFYNVPALTPDQQLAVDCPQEMHLFMDIGARVLALWGNDYYAANICGREALGRYYVHFVEDNLNRLLPQTGVVPIMALKPGTRISFIDVMNDEEIGKVCEVVEQPPMDDPDGWTHGEFKLRELDEEGTPTDAIKNVSWAKLFLNKDQGHQMVQLLKQHKKPVTGGRTSQKLNPVQDIDEENIISDARSFRRSRPSALARLSSSSTSSSVAPPPPMAIASSDDNNTSYETESTTTTSNTTPPRTPRRGRQQKQHQLTPVVGGAVTGANSMNGSGGASGGGTPVPRSAVQRRGSRTSPRLSALVEQVHQEKEEEEAEKEHEEKDQQQQQKKQEEEDDQEIDVENPDTTTEQQQPEQAITEMGSEKQEQQQVQELLKETTPTEPTQQQNEAANGTMQQQPEEQHPLQQQQQQQDEQKKMEQDNVGNAADNEQQPTLNADSDVEPIAQKRQQTDELVEHVSMKPATSADNDECPVTVKRANVVPESVIFSGLKFVLTSATRPNKKVTDFNKRDYRKKIEERGGRIIEDFSHSLAPEETAYLIADTYYRTHKYLSALSLSIPCVSYKWIQQCVAEKKLVDHRAFLLPAGESSLDSKQQFEWKPLKDILMAGKRVLIWSHTAEPDPAIVSFAEIWTPILQNLGATLLGIGPGEPFVPKSSASLEEKLAFCSKIEPPVDVLLAETDCHSEVVKLVEERAGLAVSSEWVIQAIVTGSMPDLRQPGGEKFRYDYVG